jgi:hypothetical protein
MLGLDASLVSLSAVFCIAAAMFKLQTLHDLCTLI